MLNHYKRRNAQYCKLADGKWCVGDPTSLAHDNMLPIRNGLYTQKFVRSLGRGARFWMEMKTNHSLRLLRGVSFEYEHFLELH